MATGVGLQQVVNNKLVLRPIQVGPNDDDDDDDPGGTDDARDGSSPVGSSAFYATTWGEILYQWLLYYKCCHYWLVLVAIGCYMTVLPFLVGFG